MSEITKELYKQYCAQRKALEKSIATVDVVEKYEKEKERYEAQKVRQKERYAQRKEEHGDSYLQTFRDANKKSYLKKKAGKETLPAEKLNEIIKVPKEHLLGVQKREASPVFSSESEEEIYTQVPVRTRQRKRYV